MTYPELRNWRPQRQRQRRILEMIRAGTRNGKLPNAGDFMAELEVCRRTICYDLDCLRDDENAPVEYDPQRHGFFMSDLTWQFPDLRLSDAETFALLVAVRTLEAFRGTPDEADTHAALDRFRSLLEGKLGRGKYDLLKRVSVYCTDYVPQNPGVWQKVADGVANQTSIEATYAPVGETLGTVRIDPLHLVAYRGNWYLLARDHASGSILTFAVSRLSDVVTREEAVARPEGFDPDDCFFSGLGFADSEPGEVVRLQCSPAIAAYVAERMWHPSQQVTRAVDGGVELTFQSRGGIEVKKLVLSLQPHVRVLAPARLREEIVQTLQQGIDNSGLPCDSPRL